MMILFFQKVSIVQNAFIAVTPVLRGTFDSLERGIGKVYSASGFTSWTIYSCKIANLSLFQFSQK
jgi:hypothetical protein